MGGTVRGSSLYSHPLLTLDLGGAEGGKRREELAKGLRRSDTFYCTNENVVSFESLSCYPVVLALPATC